MFYSKFKNREDAGRNLAQRLLELKERNLVVIAIPRGGVTVAYQVAKALEAPLDIIIPRKLGAPGNPELAIGSVTEDGTLIINNELIQGLRISAEYIDKAKEEQIEEIKRRRKVYRDHRRPVNLKDKTVILVDDGIATGATMRAAIKSVYRQKPRSVIVAIPVAPPETVKVLKKEVDTILCLVIFEPFFAIGQFYEDFTQVSDKEVIELITLSRKM